MNGNFEVVDFADLAGFSPADGIVGRALFGQHAQLTLVEFEPDTVAPLHTHPQEQLSIVLRGTEIFMVDGVEQVLGPMQGYVVAGNHPHGARSGTEGATALEVFFPLRQDYVDARAGRPTKAFC